MGLQDNTRVGIRGTIKMNLARQIPDREHRPICGPCVTSNGRTISLTNDRPVTTAQHSDRISIGSSETRDALNDVRFTV